MGSFARFVDWTNEASPPVVLLTMIGVSTIGALALTMVLTLTKPNIQIDYWERCLRDWPLAECQARKDVGLLK